MKKIFALIAFLIAIQLNGQITGQVKDFRLGQPIAGAEIFLANGIARTISDANGYFSLEGIPNGLVQVACQKTGYAVSLQKATVTAKEASVLLILKKEKSKKLSDNNVKNAILNSLTLPQGVLVEWARGLSVIKTDLKEEVDDVGVKRVFGEIEFMNELLGYKVIVYVNEYSPSRLDYFLRFFPVLGTEEQQKTWDDARFIAYQVSLNNFLESVLQGTSNLSGYSVMNDNNQPVNPADFLHVGFSGQLNSLRIDKRIKVVHSFNEKQYVSELTPQKQITFNDVGLLTNPDSVTITGAIKNIDVGIRLPVEYTPASERKTFKLDQYFEKTYIQTDKSYYYPGDTLWFKAYMNYQTLALIESLSKVLRVELIDGAAGGRLIEAKLLKIEDGEAWGEFILSDTLPEGYLALRAYTNWQRNFGTDQIYVKYLPLLKGIVNLGSTRNELITSDKVRIKLDKKEYFRRSRIQMTLSVSNENKEPVSAWMSVSVTDQSMVRMLPDSINITTKYTVAPVKPTTKIIYPLEKGLELKGRYLNVNKKPEAVTLTATAKPLGSFKFDTDLNANFAISGLDYWDSVTVNFTASRGKRDLEGGSIELSKFEPLALASLKWPGPIQSVQAGDFKIDKYATTLQDVIIHGKRQRVISDEQKAEEAVKKSRPFGEPDHILDGSRLNQSLPNVLEMMRGKVPGLIILFDGASYSIRSSRAGSLTLGTDPLVVIDDAPMGGPAVTSLLNINPADVVSIEIILRLTALAGSSGGNGIILIYTKSGGLRGRFADYEIVHKVKVKGYSTPLAFRGVDHAENDLPVNSDYRPTLYWNPSVVSSAKYGNTNLSFFASDSVGPYLITIEGVDANGKPFRHEQILEISQ